MGVTLVDGRVTILLNSERIIDMEADHWTVAGQNPDEKSNKFKDKAIKDFSRVGHIGLQDHGRPVWHRTIRVKRI